MKIEQEIKEICIADMHKEWNQTENNFQEEFKTELDYSYTYDLKKVFNDNGTIREDQKVSFEHILKSDGFNQLRKNIFSIN